MSKVIIKKNGANFISNKNIADTKAELDKIFNSTNKIFLKDSSQEIETEFDSGYSVSEFLSTQGNFINLFDDHLESGTHIELSGDGNTYIIDLF